MGVPVLRRILLAASDSGRVRQLVTNAPVARSVVARYVAGDAAADAVAVAGELREAGLLVTLDHLGEDTRDARQAPPRRYPSSRPRSAWAWPTTARRRPRRTSPASVRRPARRARRSPWTWRT